jgi:uncharacterized protein YciI
MLYAWMGFLKADADPIPPELQQLATDFLSQPAIKIHMFGPLREESGHRAGMLMIFEHDSHESAQSFVAASPFLEAGLYEDFRLYEYRNEAG